MANSIFRQKSIDRVSSPEQLNDYIRVTNPGIWVILAAVALLLAGFIVWGAAGKLETKLSVAAVSDSGTVTCYVKEADLSDIDVTSRTVRIGGSEYTVADVSDLPVAVGGSFPDYALHIGGLTAGEWVYEVTLNCDLPSGVYEAEIVTDSVSPISFLFN